MKKIILDYGDKQHLVNFPTSWEQVTFRMLTDLDAYNQNIKRATSIPTFAALCGLTPQQMGNVSAKSAKVLFKHLDWLSPHPEFRKLSSRQIVWEGKEIPLPTNLEGESIGQWELAQQVLASGKPQEQQIPKLVAIYLQKAVDGTFDFDRVVWFESELERTPAVQVYGAYNFFLRKWKRYHRFGIRALMRFLVQMSKTKTDTISRLPKEKTGLQHGKTSQ